jgi:hypothetical protein
MASKRTRFQNAGIVAATTAILLVLPLNHDVTSGPFSLRTGNVLPIRTLTRIYSDLSPWSCGKDMVWKVLLKYNFPV